MAEDSQAFSSMETPPFAEQLAWAKKCALPLDWLGVLEEGEILVKWTCCAEMGPIKWQFSGDWVLEGEECGVEFATIEEAEAWPKDVSAMCPRCGEQHSHYSEPEKLR